MVVSKHFKMMNLKGLVRLEKKQLSYFLNGYLELFSGSCSFIIILNMVYMNIIFCSVGIDENISYLCIVW